MAAKKPSKEVPSKLTFVLGVIIGVAGIYLALQGGREEAAEVAARQEAKRQRDEEKQKALAAQRARYEAEAAKVVKPEPEPEPEPDPVETAPKLKEHEALQIVILKKYMGSDYNAAVDLKMTNSTNSVLTHWSVQLDAFDKSGKFLGTGQALATHQAPDDTTTKQVLFLNLQIDKVHKIRGKVHGIIGTEGLLDAGKFTLELKDATLAEEEKKAGEDKDKADEKKTVEKSPDK